VLTNEEARRIAINVAVAGAAREGGRTHRADQCGAALHAFVGDVFKIVGRKAVTESGGFDGRKHHPVTALCAREHEARQTGCRNVLLVHGTNSAPVPTTHLAINLFTRAVRPLASAAWQVIIGR
jgi:hypothetical protein